MTSRHPERSNSWTQCA